MRLLLIVLLLLMALPVVGQERQRPIPESELLKRRNLEQFERLQRRWIEDMEREAREQGKLAGGLSPPAIVPDGWVHDYGYDSDLFEYLRSKYEGTTSAGKHLYVYLYADWDDDCEAFRKSVGRKDYRSLFDGNEIVMLDYAFLRAVYGARFNNLPVLLKVHPNGSVGPESVHPVSSKNEHPRKAFHKLKKFLESEGG